jgi:hypothetical protein
MEREKYKIKRGERGGKKKERKEERRRTFLQEDKIFHCFIFFNPNAFICGLTYLS